MRRSLLALAAATAVVAGCTTVGPDYERPLVDLPQTFPGAAAADAGTAALALDWWRLYGDAELDRLENRAIGANFDAAQAVARVELAEAQARETAGARRPQVDLSASAGRSQIGAGVTDNASGRTITGSDFGASLSASYEIDFWGRLRRATESARATLLASQAARDTVRLTVAAQVAQGWFALRSLDEQIAVQRTTLRTREEGLRLARARLDAGTASLLDVEQFEILRAEAAILLRDLLRQRALAVSQLGVLTADPALRYDDATGLRAAVQPPLPPPGLPSALLERRPDIRRAESQLAALNAQIGVARAAMFPTLSLTAGLGQQSGDLTNLLNAPARFWSLGFGLALPIFDGGRIAARVDQAGARQREAVGAYQAAVATAFKEVADALANLRAARESEADNAARLAAAERALVLARARFSGGYSGNLDVLDAERTAASARLEVVRNRQAQLNAGVDLIRALGGGWQGLPAQ